MREHLLVDDVQDSNGVLPAPGLAHGIDERVECHNVGLQPIGLQQPSNCKLIGSMPNSGQIVAGADINKPFIDLTWASATATAILTLSNAMADLIPLQPLILVS